MEPREEELEHRRRFSGWERERKLAHLANHGIFPEAGAELVVLADIHDAGHGVILPERCTGITATAEEQSRGTHVLLLAVDPHEDIGSVLAALDRRPVSVIEYATVISTGDEDSELWGIEVVPGSVVQP